MYMLRRPGMCLAFPKKSRGVINVPKALADEIGWKDKEKLHATYNKETQEMTIKKL